MRLFLFLVLSCFFTAACGSDKNSEVEVTASALDGRWELREARRDNVKTESLDGLYFDFQPGGVLYTNLMGEEQEGTYAFDDEEIVTGGVEPALTYEVESLDAGELVLRSSLQGFLFQFRLRRAGTDAPL